MSNAITVAIEAINIFDGVQYHQHEIELREAHDNEGWGFVEFTGYLAVIAEDLCRYVEKLDPQDFPGVFAYEVSYALGQWVRETTLRTGQLPLIDEAVALGRYLTKEFFARGADHNRLGGPAC